LFRAAIAQSGSSLVPWSYQRSHRELAFKVGAALGRNFDQNSESQELLEFLRSFPAQDVNKASTTVYVDNMAVDQMADGFTFSPVIEPEHDTAFITENMYGAIENGEMNRVPLIIGMCSEEQLTKLTESYFTTTLKNYDNDLTLLVSRNMHITDQNQLKAATEEIRNIYKIDRLQDNLAAAVRYFTDTAFSRGIIRHAQLQSKFSDVWFYMFSYHGQLGGNTGPFLDGAEKVRHSEDMGYVWTWGNWSTLNTYPKQDILTSDRYRTLFTNFVKYLNPTPEQSELLQNTIWPKVTPDNFQYLNINESLTIESNPKWEVYQKWLDIYERLAVKPYDTF
ncbi:Para-nitrobenzyl esterase, partial [Gonioctena quinquepunctata]